MARARAYLMSTDMTLGERIKRMREEAGLTQAAVAKGAVSGAFISQIEHGERHPGIAVLRHIAERLGTTPEQLVEGPADQELIALGRTSHAFKMLVELSADEFERAAAYVRHRWGITVAREVR